MIEDNIYFAGFFDGEGCITCYSNRTGYYQIKASCTNTKKEVIEQMQVLYGGGIHVMEKSPLSNSKMAWQWAAGGKTLIPFLQAVLPYLRLKKEQAEMALEFMTTIGGYGERVSEENALIREQFRERFTALNKKGVNR
jgi:hypothetical protein